MLHILRLGIDVPLRGQADADFGVPPHVLKSGRLVEELEAMGYKKTSGCTWERVLDGRRTASTICSYLRTPHGASQQEDQQQRDQGRDDRGARSRRGAQAHAVRLPVRFVLSDRRAIETEVLLPDAVGMLLLKAGARKVRNEERDSTTCGDASRWLLQRA